MLKQNDFFIYRKEDVFMANNNTNNFEVFDINTARENSKKFGDEETIKKYTANLVKIINEQIAKASNQGESRCGFSIGCSKFFGRSDINEKTAEEIVAQVRDAYVGAGYDIAISNSYTRTHFEPWACIFTDHCAPSMFSIHISWDNKE